MTGVQTCALPIYDIQRDHQAYLDKGVEFIRPLQQEAYGTVTVFKDLYGNLWDLIEPAK